ncbi:hypothetical protein Tco_1053933 [Tanacetum coccineum]|uniref:Reverse transcriptase domain-containing protein n=1 Tax=Tanacetum coccineum TaxID=301880 RepID=A0ABQ5GVD1_9ASTR
MNPLPSPNQGDYYPGIQKDLKVVEPKESSLEPKDEIPEVELKELPPHLEYAFLEENNKLPVIISKDLSQEEKTSLIKVLKNRKQAIAWKLSDIRGIDPEFCSHKILLEDDYEPSVQHQRRVNPKIHDVIKKEVEKLLDAGCIIDLRMAMGLVRSIVFLRKVMLERLAGNEFYCFLDGFSGYFQIPIEPKDQEKTTFTCPYGTFAYKPRFASQVDVNNILSKPVTQHYLPKGSESSFAKHNHMITSSSSRNSSKNMPRSILNDMVHNHNLEEAQKKSQKKDRNLESSVMHSTRLQNITNNHKPKLRSNNQTTRSLPVSKSSCVTSKVVPLVDHSRNSSPFSDFKHFVCSTCHKCVFNANHDDCITKLLKEVNSRAKIQSHKTRNSNTPVDHKSHTQKPGRQIFTEHRFSLNKSSAVHEKTNTPRSCLRWIPTGRIFNTVGLRWVPTGKKFTSSTTNVDCEPSNGSNEDITNPYECDQTLNVSAGTLKCSTPSSTTVDQDAPSPSNSQTTPETQSPIIPNDVEEDNHDIEVAHMYKDPFFGVPIPEDHPLENIIGELDRPVSTRLQLHEQALFCYYDTFLTAVEPKTYKDALI